MKTKMQFCLLAVMAAVPLAHAQKQAEQLINPRPAENTALPAPPPVWIDTNYQAPAWSASRPAGEPVYVYNQSPVAGRPPLISPDSAQKIIDSFKAAYPRLGSPRLLIYVNRELVSQNSGLKLTHGTQHIESTKTFGDAGTNGSASVRTSTDQSFRVDEQPQPTLADKQTVRDVERLFGRPLREAGASLVDQKVAAELITERPIGEVIGSADSPESRKDREAIGKIADVVVEILISSRTVSVTRISGEQLITVPDIQATAIRLSDSKILGQASSADVTNRVPPSSLVNYGSPEITEATALALMEDMTPAQ